MEKEERKGKDREGEKIKEKDVNLRYLKSIFEVIH